MSKTTYLKTKEDGGFKRVASIEDADYVRVPVNQYIPAEEYNRRFSELDYITTKYNQLLQQSASAEGQEVITISRQDYNGFLGTLRIIKDRSLQEIDRSKADKYGYTLKVADHRVYNRDFPDLKAYFISKSTAVSLKIDFETAYFTILQDLKSYYNYVDISSVATPHYPTPSAIKPLDLLFAITQRDDPSYNHEYYVDNSDKGRKIKELLDLSPQNLAFDIIRVNGNIGQGVYEVSYWATGPI